MLYSETKAPSRANLSDEDLIQRYKYTDDKDSFAEIYHRFRHLVFGVCLKYMEGNHQQSEDMTMDIFERLLTKPPGEEVSCFKAWIYKLTCYECSRVKKNDRNQEEILSEYKNVEKKSEKFMENEAFLTLISREDDEPSELLRTAIKKLPKVQRDCVRLFYLRGKSYKDIAEQLEMEDKKVKSALQNGKRTLKMTLGEQETPAGQKGAG